MTPLRRLVAIIGIFITAPIWYVLLYSILTAVHADRLMWFLYWVYLPAALFASIVEKVVIGKDK